MGRINPDSLILSWLFVSVFYYKFASVVAAFVIAKQPVHAAHVVPFNEDRLLRNDKSGVFRDISFLPSQRDESANFQSNPQRFRQFFFIVKIVSHALDFLVLLVAFASYQNHIAGLCHLRSHLDGLPAVGDG